MDSHAVIMNHTSPAHDLSSARARRSSGGLWAGICRCTASGGTRAGVFAALTLMVLVVAQPASAQTQMVTLNLSPATIGEGETAQVTAVMTPPHSGPTTVTVAYTPGGTGNLDDFNLSTNTILIIAAGATMSGTSTAVTIEAVDDSDIEPDETLNFEPRAAGGWGTRAFAPDVSDHRERRRSDSDGWSGRGKYYHRALDCHEQPPDWDRKRRLSAVRQRRTPYRYRCSPHDGHERTREYAVRAWRRRRCPHGGRYHRHTRRHGCPPD